MNTSRPFRSFDLDSAGADPSLVGHRLARLRREQNITPEQQAQALGIDLERLTALASSRMPRDAAEVRMVAARMGWEAGRLADLLGVTLDLCRQG
ncbi:MAG TPA: helix-turn-helix transcriptional regulator [Gemmataceae bacterium]